MFICKITKRDISKNSKCTDTIVREKIGKDGKTLLKDAKNYIKKEFTPAYKGSTITPFIEIKGFKDLDIKDEDGTSHNFYNGRAVMFTNYGNPLYLISIDIYTIEVVK